MIPKNHHHKTNYETDLQKDQYISKIAQANYYNIQITVLPDTKY